MTIVIYVPFDLLSLNGTKVFIERHFADSEQYDSCLKDPPQRLQTPSLTVRKSIFHDLTDLVTTTDLAENIIKGVCKVNILWTFRMQLPGLL